MHKSSFCGVNCEKCNVYIATTTDDNELKEKVIKEWGELYKRTFSIDDIKCFGCKSGVLFGLCALCDIRPCNEEKGTDSCEDCKVFPCDRMKRFYDFHKENDTGNVFD